MIIDKLDNFIIKEEIEKAESHYRRHPKVYWPSQASIILQDGEKIGTCHRQAFYQIKHIPATNPSSARNIRQRRYGKVIEEVEIDIARQNNILLADQLVFETHLKYGVIVRGKIDAVYNIDCIRKGIELKTGHGYFFQKQIWGSETKSGNPRYNNLLQVILYLDGFKNHDTFKFNELYLIYIDRGTGESQEFKITLESGHPVIDGEIDYNVNINNIYDRYYKLHYYIVKNMLPPCDYVPHYNEEEYTQLYSEKKITKKKYNFCCKIGWGQDFQCEYCNWADRCRKDRLIG